jgi:uncharacterized protein (UPF0332 family)
MTNAIKTIAEVEVLVQNRLWNIAVNRLYYACFYAVSALLINSDVSTRTHAGAIKMLGLHFINKSIISVEAGSFIQSFLQ